MTIHDVTVQHQDSDSATRKAVSKGTVYIPLRYHKKKDGTVFPVEIVGGPYTWKGKKVMFGVARDISERIQTESALLESKREYDELVAQVPVGIFKLRMKKEGDLCFDYVSPRFCSMMNIKNEVVLKDPDAAFALVHTEDIRNFIEANEKARKTEAPFKWEGRFVINGRLRTMHIESLPKRLENGDIVWSGTQRDITR
jgi:PAS domain-containing protein